MVRLLGLVPDSADVWAAKDAAFMRPHGKGAAAGAALITAGVFPAIRARSNVSSWSAFLDDKAPKAADAVAAVGAKSAAKEEEAVIDEGEHKAGLGCFPATASAYVKGRGPVRVSELEPGDLLLCGDTEAGRLAFSPFLCHVHVQATVMADYLSVKTLTTAAPLHVSREHLVFAASSATEPPSATRAADLQPGDWLCRVGIDGDLQRVQVTEIQEAPSLLGQYAPLTRRGSVIIDSLLCSCYADWGAEPSPQWVKALSGSHEASHLALLPLRSGLLADAPVEDRDAHGIHPYCQALMRFPAAAQVLA